MSDLTNLMEWNQFAEDRKTVLEVLTILNNRYRAAVSERDEARALARELRDALNNASRFVDCYTSENSAAIDDKWATARICSAALAKAKEVLP